MTGCSAPPPSGTAIQSVAISESYTITTGWPRQLFYDLGCFRPIAPRRVFDMSPIPRGPYAVLWSGGKDSALALSEALCLGCDVRRLVNFYDIRTSRVRFHAIRIALIREQARHLGIAVSQIPTSATSFATAFSTTLVQLKRHGYAGVIAGDIHLSDVRAWNQRQADHAQLHLLEPLWHRDGAALLDLFVSSGFKAVLTCCNDRWSDALWPGREINRQFVEDITQIGGLDPCGEHGEYHSFVFDGPLFSEPVTVTLGEIRRSNGFSQIDLTTATLFQPLRRVYLSKKRRSWNR